MPAAPPPSPAPETVPVVIASDHAGLDLKAELAAYLGDLGYPITDLGPHTPASVDYPDYARAVALALRHHEARFGVLICGSGIGISIAANRYKGIRAALCHDVTSARLARQHNDANVLALGARLLGTAVAQECATVFLSTAFEGGRHQNRIAKLDVAILDVDGETGLP